jgi:hypothetical protein
MNAPKKIPVGWVRDSLFVCPDSGALFWHEHAQMRAPVPLACRPRKDGYRTVNIMGLNYLAHRVVWSIVHGANPLHVIDHINGNRGDNRPGNLRDVTHAENMRNRACHRAKAEEPA